MLRGDGGQYSARVNRIAPVKHLFPHSPLSSFPSSATPSITPPPFASSKLFLLQRRFVAPPRPMTPTLAPVRPAPPAKSAHPAAHNQSALGESWGDEEFEAGKKAAADMTQDRGSVMGETWSDEGDDSAGGQSGRGVSRLSRQGSVGGVSLGGVQATNHQHHHRQRASSGGSWRDHGPRGSRHAVASMSPMRAMLASNAVSNPSSTHASPHRLSHSRQQQQQRRRVGAGIRRRGSDNAIPTRGPDAAMSFFSSDSDEGDRAPVPGSDVRGRERGGAEDSRGPVMIPGVTPATASTTAAAAAASTEQQQQQRGSGDAFDDWDSDEISELSDVEIPAGALTQSTEALAPKAPAVGSVWVFACGCVGVRVCALVGVGVCWCSLVLSIWFVCLLLLCLALGGVTSPAWCWPLV